MPDPDAHARRASAPRPLEAPDPPIIGGTRFTETKTIGSNRLTSLDDVARAPVTVSVDGNQVLANARHEIQVALKVADAPRAPSGTVTQPVAN